MNHIVDISQLLNKPAARTPESTRQALADFLAWNDPPYLHPAMLADERDCKLRAAYLGSLLQHVIDHTAAMLHDLKSQLSGQPDFSYPINRMIEMRDEVVGCVENSGSE